MILRRDNFEGKSVLYIPSDLSEIGKRRKLLGLTQRKLANKAGIAYSIISKIEGGQVANPGIKTLKAIFEAFERREHELKLRISYQSVVNKEALAQRIIETLR